MSKADGWTKKSTWEWRKSGANYAAEICKVTGNGGFPYVWSVYPTPRQDHLDDRGRYMPLGKGSCAKLAEAKAEADDAISRLGDRGATR